MNILLLDGNLPAYLPLFKYDRVNNMSAFTIVELCFVCAVSVISKKHTKLIKLLNYYSVDCINYTWVVWEVRGFSL